MRSTLLKVVSLIAVASASVFLFVNIGHSAGSPLIISEFRFRGPNGANDEFVEIYNNSDTDHTVAATDGSSGYALAASDGNARFVIPNGTVIPARGHYLGVNTIAYSLVCPRRETARPQTAMRLLQPTYPITPASRCSAPQTLQTSRSRIVSTPWARRMSSTHSIARAPGFSPLIPFSIDYSFVRKVPYWRERRGLAGRQ